MIRKGDQVRYTKDGHSFAAESISHWPDAQGWIIVRRKDDDRVVWADPKYLEVIS